MSRLTTLPVEIHLQLLKYLSVIDVLSVSAVNRFFNKICDSEKDIWLPLCRNDFGFNHKVTSYKECYKRLSQMRSRHSIGTTSPSIVFCAVWVILCVVVSCMVLFQNFKVE